MQDKIKTYFKPTTKHEFFKRVDPWANVDFEDEPDAWVQIIILAGMMSAFVSVCFLPLVW